MDKEGQNKTHGKQQPNGPTKKNPKATNQTLILEALDFQMEVLGEKMKNQRNPKKIRKGGKDSVTHSFNAA